MADQAQALSLAFGQAVGGCKRVRHDAFAFIVNHPPEDEGAGGGRVNSPYDHLVLRFALLTAIVALTFSVERLAQRVGLLPWSLEPVALDDRETDYEVAERS